MYSCVCSLSTLETTASVVREQGSLPRGLGACPMPLLSTGGVFGHCHGGTRTSAPGVLNYSALSHSTDTKGRPFLRAFSLTTQGVFLGFRPPLIPGWMLLEGKYGKLTTGLVKLRSLVSFSNPSAAILGECPQRLSPCVLSKLYSRIQWGDRVGCFTPLFLHLTFEDLFHNHV